MRDVSTMLKFDTNLTLDVVGVAGSPVSVRVVAVVVLAAVRVGGVRNAARPGGG